VAEYTEEERARLRAVHRRGRRADLLVVREGLRRRADQPPDRRRSADALADRVDAVLFGLREIAVRADEDPNEAAEGQLLRTIELVEVHGAHPIPIGACDPTTLAMSAAQGAQLSRIGSRRRSALRGRSLGR